MKNEDLDESYWILEEIRQELIRACKKHNHWPEDLIHSVAIMQEESGEAIRAALQCVYEGGNISDVEKELVQTAAMCIRALLNIRNGNTLDIITSNLKGEKSV